MINIAYRTSKHAAGRKRPKAKKTRNRILHEKTARLKEQAEKE